MHQLSEKLKFVSHLPFHVIFFLGVVFLYGHCSCSFYSSTRPSLSSPLSSLTMSLLVRARFSHHLGGRCSSFLSASASSQFPSRRKLFKSCFHLNHFIASPFSSASFGSAPVQALLEKREKERDAGCSSSYVRCQNA
eukprot:GHVS01076125.1.p2 GENE.GHVS01076125.1~~GHVS01076125.1.p2  ORF type:complete len:137 (-),score=18.21 GHVS01076125.1:1196-1606(-)